jgi:hypothetical protein
LTPRYLLFRAFCPIIPAREWFQTGLPPLDRTPVYAACLLCQNSSNSLGDM